MPDTKHVNLDERIAQILNRRPAIGFAATVVRDGVPDFFHGHGVADLSSQRPVTPDTVFRVASITKTFTAVAVMQLREAGLVDLDAPATDYLRANRLIPDSPRFASATLRQLLTHTAGIREVRHSFDALRPDR